MTSSSSRAAPREGGTAHPEQETSASEPPVCLRRARGRSSVLGAPRLLTSVSRETDGRRPERLAGGIGAASRSSTPRSRELESVMPRLGPARDAPVGNSWPTVSSAIRPPFGSRSALHRVVRAPRPVLFGRGAHPVQRNHPTPPDAPREARGLDPRLGPVVWGARPLRPARSTINGIARSRNSRDGAPTQPKGSGLRPRVSRARAPRGVPDAGGWPPRPPKSRRWGEPRSGWAPLPRPNAHAAAIGGRARPLRSCGTRTNTAPNFGSRSPMFHVKRTRLLPQTRKARAR